MVKVPWCGCLGLLASFFSDARATRIEDSDVANFTEWFKKRGGRMEGIGVTNFGSQMGRGVVATRAIGVKERIFFVPSGLLIGRECMMNEGCGSFTADQRRVLSGVRDDEDIIAIFLMREWGLGQSSEYAPYIKVLPEYVPQPLAFTDEELSLLEEPDLIMRVRRDLSMRTERYRRLQPVLANLTAGAARGKERLPDHYSLYVYLWALSPISSRALSLRGARLLVPGVDMLNYAPMAEQRATDGGSFYLEYHQLTEEGLSVMADRIVAEGDQVFEDYGDNDNRLYLEHHGFVPADNPHDCVWVTLPDLEEGQGFQAWEDKRVLASRLGITSPPSVCIRSLNPADVSAKAINYAAYASLSAGELESCRSRALRPPGAGPASAEDLLEHCFRRQDRALEGVLRSMLQKGLQDKQLRYSTTLEQDQAMLASGRLNTNQHLAVAYRASQKALMRDLGLIVAATPASDASQSCSAGEGSIVTRRADGVGNLRELVDAFNTWVDGFGLQINKIRAKAVPGMRLGAIATEDIAADEVYLGVPPQMLMDVTSAMASDLGPALRRVSGAHRGNRDAFHELLFHLTYERFVRGERSRWWPYLALLPTPEETGAPIAYTQQELKLLGQLDVREAITDYQENVRRRFESVSRNHVLRSELPPEVLRWDTYLWGHYILDSRAIWWDGQRHLVPMLDMINCAELSDPTRIHSTTLNRTSNLAVTRAGMRFQSGEQLYENYGQNSDTYFMFHGFVVPDNSHDCLQLRMSVSVADRGPRNRTQLSTALRSNGFTSRETFCLRPREPSSIQRLMTFLSIQHGVKPEAALPYLTGVVRERQTRLQEVERGLQDPVASAVARPVVLDAMRAYVTQQLHMVEQLLEVALPGLGASTAEAR